jgi:hypothetical protein
MNKSTITLGSIFILITIPIVLIAQEHVNSEQPSHLYRPQDTTRNLLDTTRTLLPPGDTLTQEQRDSIAIREKYIQDSIMARLQFIQDSIIAREKFVQDSIARRKRILDSLIFLKNELPALLEASVRIMSEEIVIHNTPIQIIGDSILTDFTFAYLIFGFNKPYIPWKTTIDLSDNPAKIKSDLDAKKIISIKTPFFYHFYEYDRNKKVVQIRSKSALVQKNNQKFFRAPLDSVFFDSKGRVVKIKKYNQYYLATANLRQGALKYTDLAWAIQYKYDYNNNISNCELVKFCERGTVNKKPDQVCSIVNYAINQNGLEYSVKRNNDPPNSYSDGTFVFTYTPDYTLKSTSFNNVSNQENWITYIETNEKGWVSRYVYKNNGKVRKTLLVNYYHDNPRAKNKYETVSCVFEDDGISYQQINNTTKKMRVRDKLTMEWSDWK